MTALPDPRYDASFYHNVPMKRGLAFVVDLIVIALISVLSLPFTAFLGVFVFPMLMAVIGFAYRVVTLALWSATPGMQLMAIEMRDQNGHRFDLGMGFIHTLGTTVSIMFGLPQLVSIVLMLTTERRQGLTDLVLGSIALNRPARRF